MGGLLNASCECEKHSASEFVGPFLKIEEYVESSLRVIISVESLEVLGFAITVSIIKSSEAKGEKYILCEQNNHQILASTLIIIKIQ